MEITQSYTSELTGIDHRTVRRRVAASNLQPIRRKGRSILFASQEIIPIALGVLDDADGQLDLSQERAKLAKAQCEKTGLEVARLKGILQPRAELVEEFGEVVTNYRQRMLSLPNKLVIAVESEDSQQAKVEAARALVYEALNALVAAGDNP